MTLKEFKMVVSEFPELSLEKEKTFYFAYVKGCGDITHNIANFYSPMKQVAINPTVKLMYINDLRNHKKDLYIEVVGTMETDSVDELRTHFKESLFLLKQYQIILKQFHSFKKQQEIEKDFENETKK
jgi:hypothetical protein